MFLFFPNPYWLIRNTASKTVKNLVGSIINSNYNNLNLIEEI